MPKVGQMIESKYLKQSDIDGEIIVTIAKIGKGNVAPDDKAEEMKWMVRFKEFPKPMVLNSTNIRMLAKICGSEDSDDWIGKEVVLWVDENVTFGGEVVGGLRVKSSVPAQAPKRLNTFADMKDDVPF